jgi:hypothetical protein
MGKHSFENPRTLGGTKERVQSSKGLIARAAGNAGSASGSFYLNDEHPASDATVRNTHPAIHATLSEPVNVDSLRESIDGRDVTPLVYATANGFDVTANFELTPGNHDWCHRDDCGRFAVQYRLVVRHLRWGFAEYHQQSRPVARQQSRRPVYAERTNPRRLKRACGCRKFLECARRLTASRDRHVPNGCYGRRLRRL